MRKIRHIIWMVLCLGLLFHTDEWIPRAYAESAMTASESCITFIKEVEGFSSKPYYDYKQHTVGYGTKCPTDKYFEYLANGITKQEAEILLLETVDDIAETIQKKLIEPYNLTFSQHQFDALVSFSFNLGTSWMTYDSTLRAAILDDADEEGYLYAFSLYCTAGGNYSTGLIHRRLWEANMFLNGVYSQTINDDYGYVFYEPNGGSLTYQVQGFVCGNDSAPAADAVRNGDVFLGWYTDLTGGSQVSKLNESLAGKTLFARWQSSEDSDQQDTLSTVIRVTGDVVNIRKGPGTNYGVSKQVYQNDILVLSHVTNLSGRNWGKVQEGWICLEYTNYDDLLEDKDTSEEDPPEEDDYPANTPDGKYPMFGTVRVNDLLRIRSGPGTAYATVGYLFNGHTVEILEQTTAGSMDWGRISRGWVSMNYIQTETPPDDSTFDPDEEDNAEPYKLEAIVLADALRIRSGPGTAYPIAGFYYQDDRIYISERKLVDSIHWGKTDKGWIHMDYVLTDSEEEEDSSGDRLGVMTVIADCLRVRKEIGTDSRIAALLYYGDTVTVLDTTKVDGTLWGKVKNGWICMDYVK